MAAIEGRGQAELMQRNAPGRMVFLPVRLYTALLTTPSFFLIHLATFVVKNNKTFPYYVHLKEGASVTFKARREGERFEGEDDNVNTENDHIIIEKEIFGPGCTSADGGVRIECKATVKIEIGDHPPPGILTSNFISFDPDVFTTAL